MPVPSPTAEMTSDAFTGTARFGVARKLGEGAFGAVYEAYDSERKTRCALKLLSHVEAGAIYRFKNEFRALSDVVHPNLCALHELVSVGDRWFFTMDLVDGVDFYAWVTSTRRSAESDATVDAPITLPAPSTSGIVPISSREMPADPDRLRDALAQLVRGLSSVHAAGKLHCDLKPSNVLVTPEGRVVLLDFGLVAELAPRLVEGTRNRVAGTPAYMSPEQARGAVLTAASDWYSLGVMLYEALTATPPFGGQTSEMLIGKQVRDPLPPSEVARSVPPDLDELAMSLLARSPGQRPSAEQILARLGATRSPASTRPVASASAPFVGRQRPLEILRDALARTQSGQAQIAFVTGPSGVGKSALVRRFLDEVDLRGSAVILEGRCYEREVVPYKALDSLVDSLTRFLLQYETSELAELLPPDVGSLPRLFPVLGRVEAIATSDPGDSPDKHELRRRAALALRDLLHRIAERSGLVLFVDDLQWGDADSAAIFLEILRAPSPPLLLLASHRPEDAEKNALISALRGLRTAEGSAHSIDLAPLDAAEATELATLLVSDDGAHAEAIARESGGSPLFVLELARHFSSDLSGSTRHAPLRLEDALIERSERLSSSAQRLLEVLSVVGRPIPTALAIEAARIETDGWASLGELRAAKLVRTTQQGAREAAETNHDRIREAVAGRLAEPRRQEIHHRIALLLENGSRVDPEALYTHFRAAGELENAAVYAARAARRATGALAFDHAATLYRFALDHGEASEAKSLRVELADALANAGRGGEAGAAYLLAAGHATGTEAIELRRRGADSQLISGRIDEGVETVKTVLASVGLGWPRSMLGVAGSLLLHRVLLKLRGIRFQARATSEIAPLELLQLDACFTVARGLAMFDPLRAVLFQSRGLWLALRAGEPTRASRALSLAASFLVTEGPGSARWARQMLELAESLAESTGDPHARGFARLIRGSMACMGGDWDTARARCEEAAQLLRDRCAGVPTEIATADSYVVTTAFYQGDHATLIERTPRILDEALSRSDLNAATLVRTGHANVRWLVLDDADGAEREVGEAMMPWQGAGFLLPHYFELLARTQIDLYRGHGAEASARVSAAWGKARRAFMLRIQPLRIELNYLRGRASVASGDLADARRCASTLLSEGPDWATGMGQLVRGGVHVASGEASAARASYRAAAVAFERASMRAFSLVARRRLAALDGTDLGEIDRALSLRRVGDPARFTALFAPHAAAPPSRRALPPASS